MNDRLPPVETIRLFTEADYYGASSLIARHLNRANVPVSFATWVHGWLYRVHHPVNVIGVLPKSIPHLVGRECEAECLRQHGIGHVYTTGLPILYSQRFTENVDRKPGTLLVMPSHAASFYEVAPDERGYLEDIDSIKDQFEQVIFCLSQKCVELGYWAKACEERGYAWIKGAGIRDRNALIRMTTIFKSVDYVTADSLGSHIAYAAWAGAKVSIFGRHPPTQMLDPSKQAKWRIYPELLAKSRRATSEAFARAHFGEFFCNPHQAKIRQEWGQQMVGAKHERSAEEIAELLGWSRMEQVRRFGPWFFETTKRWAGLYR